MRDELKKYQEMALELCEDWKPEKYWQNTEIEMIWFTKKQLSQFIKSIIEEEKQKIEK